MKGFIQQKVKEKAKRLIREHKPIVIAVTGSVGKTSVRNAVASVLSSRFRVRQTIENYNNEFGVPLTILGERSPGKSVVGWIRLLMKKPVDVPEVFVLEYAIDRPGDMAYLCDIVEPTISIFTRISPVHAEYFRSVEQLAEEKAVLLERTDVGGLCLLNADDPRVLGLSQHCHAPVRSYGFSASADVRATEYEIETREDFSFEPGETFSHVRFTVQEAEKGDLEITLENVLGKATAGSVLPAIAVARHLGMSDDEILKGLEDIELEPGRMNPIPGIKGSLIIDSSYNAAPASTTAALEVLGAFVPVEGAKRVAALGHMAELGQYSEQEHRMIGMRAAEAGVDLLVTVGEPSQDIRRGAIEAGIPEVQTQHFSNAMEAGRWLDREINKGDIILVKGSQSARMEKVVKDLMAEPLRAKELLVRQSAKWINE